MTKATLIATTMFGVAGVGVVASTQFAAADTVAEATYAVQEGDTLQTIADDFWTTDTDIAMRNQLPSVDTQLWVGQQLQVAQGNRVEPLNVAVDESQFIEAPVVDAAVDYGEQPVEATEAPVVETGAAEEVVAPVIEAPAPVEVFDTQVAPEPAAEPVVPSGGGSAYDEFIAAGGTDAMWQAIVMPESTGNPDAVSPNGYRGLGQTKEAWGVGSVTAQTQGMLNYAAERYGSVDNAISFRAANGWW